MGSVAEEAASAGIDRADRSRSDYEPHRLRPQLSIEVDGVWNVEHDAGHDSGGKDNDPTIRYDWIHTDQVAWYHQTSRELETRRGSKMPGLMYFHIPLLEFQEMILTRKVLGERHEPESPSRINSGLFAAVFDRGDVKGIFCGHDHVNNYVGKFHGVTLGYNGVVGFHGYPHTPPNDPTNDRARGARVFALDASDPGRFRTWMRFRDGATSWEHSSDAYEFDEIK